VTDAYSVLSERQNSPASARRQSGTAGAATVAFMGGVRCARAEGLLSAKSIAFEAGREGELRGRAPDGDDAAGCQCAVRSMLARL
jgi:hypothetical protein